ncbi:MAG: hypothetical protein Q4G47_00465 [Lachnospiraceae bacterium]|nr:hypothetical protein [Lachnospiraceae bacterium]
MHAFRRNLDKILEGVEVILSVFLIAVLVVAAIRLIFTTFFTLDPVSQNGSYYIESVMTLAIGIEFAKMMYHHTPGTIIEVLLFAISRHMITEHLTQLETVLGVLAIAGLFAIKKYLFSNFNEHERIVVYGQTTVKKMALLYGVKIPADGSRLLCDVVREHLARLEMPVEVGTSFSLGDAMLRIEEMQDGSIKKVELVRVRSIFE